MGECLGNLFENYNSIIFAITFCEASGAHSKWHTSTLASARLINNHNAQ